MNNRFFSNGMQIYALFFTLQIFLNIFCKFFSIIFSKISNTMIFKDLKNDDFLTFFEVFLSHRKYTLKKMIHSSYMCLTKT